MKKMTTSFQKEKPHNPSGEDQKKATDYKKEKKSYEKDNYEKKRPSKEEHKQISQSGED